MRPRSFQLDWLKGQKARSMGVAKALAPDPHLSTPPTWVPGSTPASSDPRRFRRRHLVMAGSVRASAGSLRSAGYTPEQVDLACHAPPLRSRRGLHTHDGDRVFPNAEVYVAQAESDLWLSPEIAAKAPKVPSFLRERASHPPRRTSRPAKWHNVQAARVDRRRHADRPASGSYPRACRLRIFVTGEEDPVLGRPSSMAPARSQLKHPEVTAVLRRPTPPQLTDTESIAAPGSATRTS